MKRRLAGPIVRAYERVRGSAFLCLLVHFFRRFFTGETISIENDMVLDICGILGFLALPGAILPLLLLPKYSSFLRWLVGQTHFNFEVASIPDKYILLTLTMTITAIVSILKWEALFPDQLDYANLASIPAKVSSIFLAKFIALMLFVGLFILALNAASSVLFPLVVVEDQAGGNVFLRFMAATFLSTFLGSIFMFFFFMAFIGLLMVLLPSRHFRRISTGVQFLSVVALMTLLFFTPQIASLLQTGDGRTSVFVRWLPTVWFLGLYQQLVGAADAFFHAQARQALDGLELVMVLSLALYTASYRRFFLRAAVPAEPIAANGRRMMRLLSRWLHNLMLRRPFDRACFDFALSVLLRSQVHRLLLAAFAGLGVAVAVLDMTPASSLSPHGTLHTPGEATLPAILAVVFFLLCGLRFAFNIPVNLHANWAFSICGDYRKKDGRRIARKLMLLFLAPLVIANAAICSATAKLWFAVAHTGYMLLVSMLLIEALLIDFSKIPFACAYHPGKYNYGLALALYSLAFFLFSPGLAHLEESALSLPSPIPFLSFLAFLVVALIATRSYARKLETSDPSLVFEDPPQPIVPSMDLR